MSTIILIRCYNVTGYVLDSLVYHFMILETILECETDPTAIIEIPGMPTGFIASYLGPQCARELHTACSMQAMRLDVGSNSFVPL